jgi:hypothetical protein
VREQELKQQELPVEASADIMGSENHVRITRPNHLEKSTWRDVPQFRLFVLEFLSSLSFIDHGSGHLADNVFTLQLPLTLHMLEHEQFEDLPDMTALEKARYSACVMLVLTRLQKVSGCPVG